jgi:integrase/recombinase XerC
MAASTQVRREPNGALVKRYVRDMERRRLTSITIYNYLRTYRIFLDFLGEQSLLTVTTDDIEAFLDRPRVRSSKGRAIGEPARPATISKERYMLQAFYGWLLRKGFVTANPAEDAIVPEVRNTNPRPIELGLWKAIWFSDRVTDDEAVLLGLGMFCGLRREEMVRLRRDQVDLDGMRLVGFRRKLGSDDTFWFGDAIAWWQARMPEIIGTSPRRFLDPLERLVNRDGGSDYVISWGELRATKGTHRKHPLPHGQASPEIVNKYVRKLCLRLGLPPGAFTPHSLRHGFCSYLVLSGVPIEEVRVLANHATITTTQRYVQIVKRPLSHRLIAAAPSLESPLPEISKWSQDRRA